MLTPLVVLLAGGSGTGKTRTACHLINIAVRLNQKKDVGKVLAVACSNVAADNLLEGQFLTHSLKQRQRGEAG